MKAVRKIGREISQLRRTLEERHCELQRTLSRRILAEFTELEEFEDETQDGDGLGPEPCSQEVFTVSRSSTARWSGDYGSEYDAHTYANLARTSLASSFHQHQANEPHRIGGACMGADLTEAL